MTACHTAGLDGEARFDAKTNPELKKTVRAARQALLPESALQQAILYARQGYTRVDIPTYSTDWDSDAYLTVSGQNSNNSVRVTNDFLEQVIEDREWPLIRRTDGRVAKTAPARALWNKITYAAWASADPGIQYDTTINEWHTCPNSGRINASNPCSEYMFLDDTACNLASLNLIAFARPDGSFDVAGFAHAVRLWTVVLEISAVEAEVEGPADHARLIADAVDVAVGNVANVDEVAFEVLLEDYDVSVGDRGIHEVIHQQIEPHARRHAEYRRQAQRDGVAGCRAPGPRHPTSSAVQEIGSSGVSSVQ